MMDESEINLRRKDVLSTAAQELRSLVFREIEDRLETICKTHPCPQCPLRARKLTGELLPLCMAEKLRQVLKDME